MLPAVARLKLRDVELWKPLGVARWKLPGVAPK
jgi:hypothetical protein